MQMIDGNGNAVEMVGITDIQREEYILSYFKDERARDEVKHLIDLAEWISSTVPDDDIAADAGEILLCLEAIVSYESGHFKGKDYWSEVYWENYKRYYT